MEQVSPQEVEQMLALVSQQRREQALRYKHTLGRFCCLKSWLMLRDLLDEGMKELMDEWEYNEHGKPSFHLSPLTSHLYFSLSHCKQGIAVAVSDQPVGIDIDGGEKNRQMQGRLLLGARGGRKMETGRVRLAGMERL